MRNGARITTHADVTSPRGGFVLLATARTAQQAQFIFGARQPGSRTFPPHGGPGGRDLARESRPGSSRSAALPNSV